MTEMTVEDENLLKQQFVKMDRNGMGMIGINDIKHFLSQANPTLDRLGVEMTSVALMGSLDPYNKGDVTYDDFVRCKTYGELQIHLGSIEEIQNKGIEILSTIGDPNKTGKISRQFLEKQLSFAMSKIEKNEFMNQLLKLQFQSQSQLSQSQSQSQSQLKLQNNPSLTSVLSQVSEESEQSETNNIDFKSDHDHDHDDETNTNTHTNTNTIKDINHIDLKLVKLLGSCPVSTATSTNATDADIDTEDVATTDQEESNINIHTRRKRTSKNISKNKNKKIPNRYKRNYNIHQRNHKTRHLSSTTNTNTNTTNTTTTTTRMTPTMTATSTPKNVSRDNCIVVEYPYTTTASEGYSSEEKERESSVYTATIANRNIPYIRNGGGINSGVFAGIKLNYTSTQTAGLRMNFQPGSGSGTGSGRASVSTTRTSTPKKLYTPKFAPTVGKTNKTGKTGKTTIPLKKQAK